jgi:hypothetical protein
MYRKGGGEGNYQKVNSKSGFICQGFDGNIQVDFQDGKGCK